MNNNGASQEGSWTFGRFATCLFITLIGGLAGAVVGLLSGAAYGGNYVTSIELAGRRGYEATGLIGEIVGFVVLGLFAFGITALLTRRGAERVEKGNTRWVRSSRPATRA
jgi:hypothetical protein